MIFVKKRIVRSSPPELRASAGESWVSRFRAIMAMAAITAIFCCFILKAHAE